MSKKKYLVIFQFTFLQIFSISNVNLYSDLKDFYFKPPRRYTYFVEDYYNLYKESLYHSTQSNMQNIHYLKTALNLAEKNTFWAHPSKSFAYLNYNWSNPPLKTGKNYPFRKEDPPFTMAHHAKYRLLMKMRISLLLVKSYLKFASRYDKENLYWFNIEDYENLPYIKKQKKEHYLLRSFKIAKYLYNNALNYWNKCKKYVKLLWEGKYKHIKNKSEVLFRKIDLKGPNMDKMEDEVFKIYHQNSSKYKKEKNYYFTNPHPEYNYSKIINSKIISLKTKKEKLLYYINLYKPEKQKSKNENEITSK